MTSALPKKHRTTRWNIRRLTVSRYLGIVIPCAILAASTSGGIFGQDQTSNAPPAVQAPRVEKRMRVLSPVDRLKARSPKRRWNRLNKFYGQKNSLRGDAPEAVDFPFGAAAGHGDAIGVFRPTRQQIEGPPAANRYSPSATPSAKSIDDEIGLPNDRNTFAAEDGMEKFSPLGTSNDLEMPERFSESSVEHNFDNPDTVDQNQFDDRAETFELLQQPAGNGTNDEIYREIEDEFPRIQVETPILPESENFSRQSKVDPLLGTPVSAQEQRYGRHQGSRAMDKLISSPKDLKPLSEIQPFFDYEPDPDVRKKDPYLNVLPRPDDAEGKPGDPSPAYPELVDLGDDLYQQRNLAHVDYPWMASDVYHRPLYFDDVDFERYGHTHHPWIQPFVSVGRFGVQLISLPYQMSLQPVWQRQYALGWYRPGDSVPYRYYQLPWNTDAAVRTGLFYTGMAFAYP